MLALRHRCLRFLKKQNVPRSTSHPKGQVQVCTIFPELYHNLFVTCIASQPSVGWVWRVFQYYLSTYLFWCVTVMNIKVGGLCISLKKFTRTHKRKPLGNYESKLRRLLVLLVVFHIPSFMSRSWSCHITSCHCDDFYGVNISSKWNLSCEWLNVNLAMLSLRFF